jgi:hypothetical protein
MKTKQIINENIFIIDFELLWNQLNINKYQKILDYF